MSSALKRWSLAYYSMLALPLAFAGIPLYIHAPDFYATQAGLSLATIGAVLLIIRLFDAVQDPLIGYLSNKFSQLRPAIMLGALFTMALGFFMLFHPPESFILGWFALNLILATSAFSVLSINFNALGSLWSTNTHQKTRITTWREGFGLVGLIIAAVLPSIIGLPLASSAFVGILAISGSIFFLWNRTHRALISDNEGVCKSLELRPLFHASNIKLYAVYTLSMLASAIPAVLVLFFIRDRLDAESLTGLFLLLYFISGAAGMPLWQKVAARTGKLKAWFISMIVAIVNFIWAYFLNAGDLWQYGAICLFSGIALGAELALPPAILSDVIDRQDTRDQTSFYFSVLSFLSKSALALGSFIAFFVLGQAAFVPAAENSSAALHSLSFTYALLPCLIKIFAAVGLWHRIKHEGDPYENIERSPAHGTNGIS